MLQARFKLGGKSHLMPKLEVRPGKNPGELKTKMPNHDLKIQSPGQPLIGRLWQSLPNLFAKSVMELSLLVLLPLCFFGFLPLENMAQEASAQTDADRQPIRIKSAIVSIAESVDLPAERSGVLVELKVAPGQTVTKGQLVAKVKDDGLSLQLEHARLEHELAKMAAESKVDLLYSQKSYDVAVSDLRRSENANLRVPNSVPQAKLEKQGLEKDRTELKLEQARRDLEMAAFRTQLTSSTIKMAQADLAKTKVTAPMSGLVVAVEKRVGEWVEASNVVCTVVRTDRLWIQGLLPAQQAAKIAVGTPVQIEFQQDWVQSKRVAGEIVFVSPEVNPINGMVQVRAEFPNDRARVPTGLKADIVIGR